MAYNPIGKLLGNCPFNAADQSPPNASSASTPQPAGTKFFAGGESFTARALNRALSGLAENVDGVVGDSVRSTDTVYRRDSVIGDGSSIRFQLNDWVYIGDGAGLGTTGQPGEFSSVYDPTDNVSYVNPSGEFAKITKFEEPGAVPPVSINDGTERAHTTATTVTLSEGSRITVTPNWVSNDDVIPGLRVEIKGSTGGDEDGTYQANNFKEASSTEVDLANFRHRLRITGASVLWAIGDGVKDTAVGSVTGVVKWVDGATPTVIAEVEVTSAKDFTGITGITNSTNLDTATISGYEKPGDPVMLDQTKVDGIATAQVFTDGFSYYKPIAVIRAGTAPGPDALPAAVWEVAFKSPRLHTASDEGSRFPDTAYINRDTLEDHLKNHPGPGTIGPIKITPSDSRAGYTQSDPTKDKLVAGSGITFTVLTPGGDEQLRIDASGGAVETGRFLSTNRSGGTLSKGAVVTMKASSGDNEVTSAKASGVDVIDGEVVGVLEDTVIDNATEYTQVNGVAMILMPVSQVGQPGEPFAGLPIWLHPTQDGRATVEAPTAGQINKRLGTIIDASAYLGNTDSDSIVSAVWRPEIVVDSP